MRFTLYAVRPNTLEHRLISPLEASLYEKDQWLIKKGDEEGWIVCKDDTCPIEPSQACELTFGDGSYKITCWPGNDWNSDNIAAYRPINTNLLPFQSHLEMDSVQINQQYRLTSNQDNTQVVDGILRYLGNDVLLIEKKTGKETCLLKCDWNIGPIPEPLTEEQQAIMDMRAAIEVEGFNLDAMDFDNEILEILYRKGYSLP